MTSHTRWRRVSCVFLLGVIKKGKMNVRLRENRKIEKSKINLTIQARNEVSMARDSL